MATSNEIRTAPIDIKTKRAKNKNPWWPYASQEEFDEYASYKQFDDLQSAHSGGSLSFRTDESARDVAGSVPSDTASDVPGWIPSDSESASGDSDEVHHEDNASPPPEPLQTQYLRIQFCVWPRQTVEPEDLKVKLTNVTFFFQKETYESLEVRQLFKQWWYDEVIYTESIFQTLCTRLNRILARKYEDAPTRTIGDIQLRPGKMHQQQLLGPDFDVASFDTMAVPERWTTLVKHGQMRILYVDYDMAGAQSKQFSLFAAATGIPVDRSKATYDKPGSLIWVNFHADDMNVRIFYADWDPKTKEASYREELLIPGVSLFQEFPVISRLQVVVGSKSIKG
jgi:hypothetical protein